MKITYFLYTKVYKMQKSSNIDIPPPPKPNKYEQRERSLSEAFDALSLDSKERVMALAGGVKPTSTNSALSSTPPSRRHRFDSTDLSPVSLSILKYHGMYKKDCD